MEFEDHDSCPDFKEWIRSNDEYLYYSEGDKKFRGDGEMGDQGFIFNFCPFCGAELK